MGRRTGVLDMDGTESTLIIRRSYLHCPSRSRISCILILLSLILMIPPLVTGSLRNPYEILGVKQSSSITEIKHQYKQLVRNWYVLFQGSFEGSFQVTFQIWFGASIV